MEPRVELASLSVLCINSPPDCRTKKVSKITTKCTKRSIIFIMMRFFSKYNDIICMYNSLLLLTISSYALYVAKKQISEARFTNNFPEEWIPPECISDVLTPPEYSGARNSRGVSTYMPMVTFQSQ